MSLSRAKRLQPVVEMAQKAEREAARQLGHCQGLVGQAEAKLWGAGAFSWRLPAAVDQRG